MHPRTAGGLRRRLPWSPHQECVTCFHSVMLDTQPEPSHTCRTCYYPKNYYAIINVTFAPVIGATGWAFAATRHSPSARVHAPPLRASPLSDRLDACSRAGQVPSLQTSVLLDAGRLPAGRHRDCPWRSIFVRQPHPLSFALAQSPRTVLARAGLKMG